MNDNSFKLDFQTLRKAKSVRGSRRSVLRYVSVGQ